MAYNLPLPEPYKSQRWKVKIRELERLEPPHVSILHKAKTWRWDLRNRRFMDNDPPVREVPEEIITLIISSIEILISEWDKKYSHNKVNSGVDL